MFAAAERACQAQAAWPAVSTPTQAHFACYDMLPEQNALMDTTAAYVRASTAWLQGMQAAGGRRLVLAMPVSPPQPASGALPSWQR